MDKHSLAARMALDLISEAEEALGLLDNPDEAMVLLLRVLDIQKLVEHFRSRKDTHRGMTGLTTEEIQNHRIFTQVLTRACALAWYLEDGVLAEQLYKRALAWADEPMCSNKQQYDDIVALWKRLHAPWWRRLFSSLFGAIGDYEIHKQGAGQ
jgi:hypothetical protein